MRSLNKLIENMGHFDYVIDGLNINVGDATLSFQKVRKYAYIILYHNI